MARCGAPAAQAPAPSGGLLRQRKAASDAAAARAFAARDDRSFPLSRPRRRSSRHREAARSGRQFGCDAGSLRQLIPTGLGAHDIGFDHDIGRAADHNQMLDVVAAYQHQPAAAVNGGGIDHRQSRHPATIGVGAKAIGGESANQPGGQADQRQDGHKCEEKCQCLHTCPRQKRFLQASRLPLATRQTLKGSLRLELFS